MSSRKVHQLRKDAYKDVFTNSNIQLRCREWQFCPDNIGIQIEIVVPINQKT